MYAKSLERLLIELTSGSDFTRLEADDMELRFEKLRDDCRLPRGRERRDALLGPHQVANAVLALVAGRAPVLTGATRRA